MSISDIELILGDCLEVMRDLADDGVKVDLVLTDPPYGTTACKWDTIIPFDKLWECLDNITNPNTPIALFGSEPFSSNLRMSNIKNYRYDWIWDKQYGSNPFLSKKRPFIHNENISMFYKKQCNYYPQRIPKRPECNSNRTSEESKKPKLLNSQIIGSNANSKHQIMKIRYYEDDGYRLPKNILVYNSQSKECNNHNRVHPTQKPVALLEYLIKTYTKENDTILDFTMDSGSTGVACLNTNRNFIGIELDETYFEIAKERIKEAKSQTKLM